jgi:5-methylcytosine-specific restriction endonuclease McrA
MATLVLKFCPGCGHELELTCFHKGSGYCKDCKKRRAAAHYAKPEVKKRVLAHQAEYYQGNREQRLARVHPQGTRHHLAWQKRHPEEAARRSRDRRAMHAAAPSIPYTVEQLAQRLSMFSGCWMCGGEANSVDHVKPLAKGGWDCLSNLRPACVPCNSRKSAKWPFELVFTGKSDHLG